MYVLPYLDVFILLSFDSVECGLFYLCNVLIYTGAFLTFHLTGMVCVALTNSSFFKSHHI